MKNLKIITIALTCIIVFSCKKENIIQSTDELHYTGLGMSDPNKIMLLPIADTSEFFRLRLAQFQDSFSLNMPPVRDQGKEGSCTAFAVAYACQSYYFNTRYLKNYALGEKGLFSPRFLHNNTKTGDCKSASVTYTDAFEFMENSGVSTWANMPYISGDNCDNKGTIEQIERASYFKLETQPWEAYRIQDTIKNYFKYLLYEKKSPIMIGVDIDTGFMKKGNRNQFFIWKNSLGGKKEGHAMVIVGWDDNVKGTHIGAWKVMNSWGPNWGDNGYAWIAYNYLPNVIKRVNGFNNQYFAFVMEPKIDTVGIKPKIKTLTPLNIKSTSASLIATMSSTGADNEISERGFAYGKTLMDLTIKKTTDLILPGFSTFVEDLTPDTYYYALSYAKNVYGVTWDTLATRFKTLPSVPGGGGNVSDIEGNVYNTIEIGTQTWMVENLRTTRYNDGTAISTGLSNVDWQSTSSGAYANYNNNVDDTYGKLYNWYAVNTGKLAPTGWHVPTDAEWTTLTSYLGGESVAGGAMKATTLWDSPNTNATNSSGFTGLPAGVRFDFGFYDGIGKYVDFWSSTEYDTGDASILYLNYSNSNGGRGHNKKEYGFSVRCVKN